MFERLSNEDISAAVDELVTTFGVKEEIPCASLIAMLEKRDTQGCVQEIAAQLGLPIRIRVSYVPKDFRPTGAHGFRSNALSRTDWAGHGVAGITAQVSIPSSLPLYGSTSLSGYPIDVRVSENCLKHPETFVAVIAHELSHVLLQSVLHPRKESELHTDLVPVILGFRDSVRKGRKNVLRMSSGGVTTTHTTTYGYLTDSQFEFASDKIGKLLKHHQLDKQLLLTRVTQVNRRIRRATRRLVSFREYLAYVDTHLTARMTEEDARRVVRFHAWDYTRGWENSVTQAERVNEGSAAFAGSLTHYTSTAVARLGERTASLDRTVELLDRTTEEIAMDVKTLRRYVSPIYRLRRAAWRSFLERRLHTLSVQPK